MIHMVQNRDSMEIILLLLKGELHLRGIAKNLNMSHSTISRRLNELLDENVLDFRTKGRNKTFSIRKTLQAKNHVYNAERYKLEKLLKLYPEMEIIIEDILANHKERLIILFGSYAKFSAKKSSDIDIYIETNKKPETTNSKISMKTGSFNLTSVLIKEIIKNHVILRGVEDFYEKTSFFKEIKTRAEDTPS